VASAGPGEAGARTTDHVDLAALSPGDLVRAQVVGSDGVDLIAVPVEMRSAARGAGRAGRFGAVVSGSPA